MLRSSRLAALALLTCSCAAAPAEEETESSDSALSRPVGGDTGAFLREVTPAGYSCIATTFVLPDYTTTDPARGTPWVYFGFSDDAKGLDAEIGFSFQHGDGTASRPRRWLPYIRRGSAFYYADEAEAVRPGGEVSLLARLSGDTVYVKRDDRAIAYHRNAETINGISLAGINAARVHVRRVVGQAVNGRYDGRPLATLGPVTMSESTVCDPSGNVVAFSYSAAGVVGEARRRASLAPRCGRSTRSLASRPREPTRSGSFAEPAADGEKARARPPRTRRPRQTRRTTPRAA